MPLRSPIALMSAFDTYRPSVDELLRQFERNFAQRDLPKSQPVRELNLEIVLSPAEALRGEHVPVDVPVAELCMRCEGTGRTGSCECDLCEGHGMSWDTARIDVFIPPMQRGGTIIPISLRHLGVRNLFLNVHVRVGAAVSS